MALILLSVSVFPTLLLLFAHPENTFALIIIHVALFYTETVIGAYVIEQLNKHIHPRERPVGYGPLGGSANQSSCSRKCLLIIGILALVPVLILVYFSLVWLYQFLILRNSSSNIAFDMIIQYVPTVAIAAFGFFVSQTNKQQTMNGKNAKRWLKLGELLDTDLEDQDLDKNKKKQIRRLKEAFKITNMMHAINYDV